MIKDVKIIDNIEDPVTFCRSFILELAKMALATDLKLEIAKEALEDIVGQPGVLPKVEAYAFSMLKDTAGKALDKINKGETK